MPLGLDILIGFVCSASLGLNLGSFLLPSEYRWIFSTIISLRNAHDRTQTLDIDFHGQCFLSGEAIPFGEALFTAYQASLTGYESEDVLETVQSFLVSLRPLRASYTIFYGLLLLACYGLLTFEWIRLEEAECKNCQRKIVRGHKNFAILCMGVATLSGLAAAVGLIKGLESVTTVDDIKSIGMFVSLDLSKKLGNSIYDQHVGSTWIICLFVTLGLFYGTVWLAMSDTASLMPPEREGAIALGDDATSDIHEKASFVASGSVKSVQHMPPMA